MASLVAQIIAIIATGVVMAIHYFQDDMARATFWAVILVAWMVADRE